MDCTIACTGRPHADNPATDPATPTDHGDVELLLERHVPVDVMLDGGWRLTAQVMAVGMDHVDLGPLTEPIHLPAQLRWCGATISWKTRIGAAHR